MENSRNSMRNIIITSSSQEKREDNNDDSPEESSWTFYIQDFLCENEHANQNNSPSSSFYDMSASLLSDAASSAVKIENYQKDGRLNVNYKKKNFRKRKVIQGGAMDDDLEDTASSPVNSPKVSSYMNDFEMKQMKQKEFPGVYRDEVAGRKSSSSRDGGGEDNGDMTELKKRGLCLVPLSNVANYFSY